MSTILIPVSGSARPAQVDHWNRRLVEGPTWHLNVHGYAAARMGGRRGALVLMHRLITGAPDGVMIDHADRDRLNNLEANLRVATSRQQQQNCGRKPSSSPYKGVSYVSNAQKRRKRWIAYISVPVGARGKGRRWVIGYYETPEEAAEVYDREARRLYGEWACTNQDLGLL